MRMSRRLVACVPLSFVTAACSTLSSIEGSDSAFLPAVEGRVYFERGEPRSGWYAAALAFQGEGEDSGSLDAGEELRLAGQSLFGPLDYDTSLELRVLQVGVGRRTRVEQAALDFEFGLEAAAGKLEVESGGSVLSQDLDGEALYLAFGGEGWLDRPLGFGGRYSFSVHGGGDSQVLQVLEVGLRYRFAGVGQLGLGLGIMSLAREGGGDSEIDFTLVGPRLALALAY